MVSEELKPCPFCGTPEPQLAQPRATVGWWVIECRDCPALMEEETEEAIVAAWNTRANSQPHDDGGRG
jgi:Lar family restriction alleviation protein